LGLDIPLIPLSRGVAEGRGVFFSWENTHPVSPIASGIHPSKKGIQMLLRPQWPKLKFNSKCRHFVNSPTPSPINWEKESEDEVACGVTPSSVPALESVEKAEVGRGLDPDLDANGVHKLLDCRGQVEDPD